jgi:hypothetical protein
MANDTTKEAYMIIRNEYGENMWRQLGMDDCDDRGLIDELNWTQENYDITNAQDLADVELGRKSIRSFNKAEEEEEKIKLSDTEMEDLAFRLADYLCESFIILEDQDEQYADLLAAVEKILEEDVPNPENTRDCYNWCNRWYKKIEGMTYSWYNNPNPLSFYEEQEEGINPANDPVIRHETAIYALDTFKRYYPDLLEGSTDKEIYKAICTMLDKTGDYPEHEAISAYKKWCVRNYSKIKDLISSPAKKPTQPTHSKFISVRERLPRYPHRTVTEESEETEFSEALNQIIDNSLGFWDAWEMSKRGQATKKEVEIAGVLLDLFEILMYEGYGEILNKVSSGEIDKRELKRIIVDILLNQDVDTYPRGESQRHSWVRKHNEEIIRRLEDKFRTEEQEEEPWEIHYPTEKELMNIARLNKVSVDDIFEAEICDHYLFALEYNDDTALDEEDEKLLDEWCAENRYLHQLTQNAGEFPEAYFGKCDICGMAGNVVPVLCVKRA